MNKILMKEILRHATDVFLKIILILLVVPNDKMKMNNIVRNLTVGPHIKFAKSIKINTITSEYVALL